MASARRVIVVTVAVMHCIMLLRATDAAGLQDDPVVGRATVPLDGVWTWQASEGSDVSVPAKVPGDLLSDLQAAGAIPDPLTDTNFLNATLWNDPVWTVTRTFATPADTGGATGQVWLVLDGVKMGASVFVNGVPVGVANDQFLRFMWPVQDLLAAAGSGSDANNVSIAFPSNNRGIDVQGRFMACTGGWDWAPYSNTFDVHGAHTFSKGVWKSVYLTTVAPVAITSLVPHTFYNGSYPTAPLTDASHSPFRVSVAVHLSAPAGASVTVSATGNWSADATTSKTVTLARGDSVVELELWAKPGVRLWWPNNMGDAVLYNVVVSVTPTSGGAGADTPLTTSRRVGFRVVELVTANTTDAAALEGKTGSGNFTMRLRVNGADVFARGANLIPMEELEGRASATAIATMVASAADANMNMLRVWGGGIFQYNQFYDTCDERGIMLYHDFMYAQEGHSPLDTITQDREIRYQARRLSAHPSIVIWDGCNECGGQGIYTQFVMTTVAEEDKSRAVWPSSPAKGWSAGVFTLTDLPTGGQLIPKQVYAGAAATHGSPATASQPGALTASPGATISSSGCGVGLAGGGCSFQANMDYDTSEVGDHPAAASPAACCQLCAAASSTCGMAVFYDGACWFKTRSKTHVPVWSAGRVACFPTGHDPVPPAPAVPAAPPVDMETHGPYQHGNGFKTVNSPAALQLFAPDMPPQLAPPTGTGVQQHGTFNSEGGCVVMSSFESMTGTLGAGNWSVQAPAFVQRNYAAANIIETYFGTQNLSLVGEAPFKRQLYQVMIGQALQMKSTMENHRASNVFGTLIWQLNEIWPTGGWGSLEYGSAVPGQVLGGRWKPLHYILARTSFADVLATCGVGATCYVRNDAAVDVSVTMNVTVVDLATGVVSPVSSHAAALPAGPASMAWFCVGGEPLSAANFVCQGYDGVMAAAGCSGGASGCALNVDVHMGGAAASSPRPSAGPGARVTTARNLVLLAPPSSLQLQPVTVTAEVVQSGPDSAAVHVTASGTGVALYTVLTTAAAGRFSDNNLLVVAGGAGVTVDFLPFGALDVALLKSTLRVEHMQQNL